ncbi:MAG TPA: hypothetical protein VHT51_04355 [Micropepsaceae bacterium]|jgi:hypothetical protein|nr:hypothetical protein [Micropepsaceae bacterium]
MQAHAVTSKKHDQSEVDRNYEAFRKMLPDLLKSNPGQFALMNNGQVVDFFTSLGDAVRFGKEKFGDHKFSVQEVTSQSVNLGFHSYALYHLPN